MANPLHRPHERSGILRSIVDHHHPRGHRARPSDRRQQPLDAGCTIADRHHEGHVGRAERSGAYGRVGVQHPGVDQAPYQLGPTLGGGEPSAGTQLVEQRGADVGQTEEAARGATEHLATALPEPAGRRVDPDATELVAHPSP